LVKRQAIINATKNDVKHTGTTVEKFGEPGWAISGVSIEEVVGLWGSGALRRNPR
jgi:hypothetical protein